MLLLWAVYTACVHPPRRSLPYLAFVALAAVLPFAYESWDSLGAVQLSVQLVLWFALGMFATHWTDNVRSTRLRLQQEGDAARLSARTDPLTGLDNRLALDEILAAELHRARAGRQPLSVLVADLNDFKDINDRFGHLNGDACLREVAAALDAGKRGLDRCFRWGRGRVRDGSPRHRSRSCRGPGRAPAPNGPRPPACGPTAHLSRSPPAPRRPALDVDPQELLGTADLALLGVQGGHSGAGARP